MNLVKENKIAYLGRIAWVYIKYQILTKVLLLFIVFPVFKLILKKLIASTGRVGISSGDYLSFLFSLQGLGLLLISTLVLILLIGTDINAFIIMSALIKENRIKLKSRQLLLVGIKSLKSFLKPSGILVMLYIAIIVPLVGIGFSVSIMDNFEIPNFITDVIFNNKIYFLLYSCTIISLAILTTIFIFFFHYLIIDNQNIGNSLLKSYNLMKKHWKEFIKEFLFKSVFLYTFIIFIIIVILYTSLIYTQVIEDIFFRRLSSIFISLFIAEIFGLLGIMILPFVCYKLTDLFYLFNDKDGYKVKFNMNVKAEDLGDDIFKKINFKTKFSLVIFFSLLVVFNFTTASFYSVFFDEIFKANKEIDIVAHRGGGDLAAENSILGMKKAMENGAKWSEIDVQRTKDGYYIINHDSTFKRVSGVDKKSSEMTLDEIKNLKIKDLFDSSRESQFIPTLEEYLIESKGKIGLFIELKGSTADNKMVDDVVELVRKYKMENEVAILSLDYNLITYTEAKYPEMKTGYLYFFSIGDTKSLKADILIMEEREATYEKIEAIHQAGKQAIVWTVNTDESIKKFLSSDVDGIITDYVIELKEGIKERDNRSDIEIILDDIIE